MASAAAKAPAPPGPEFQTARKHVLRATHVPCESVDAGPPDRRVAESYKAKNNQAQTQSPRTSGKHKLPGGACSSVPSPDNHSLPAETTAMSQVPQSESSPAQPRKEEHGRGSARVAGRWHATSRT